MKKVVSLSIAIALLFVFAACGTPGAQADPNTTLEVGEFGPEIVELPKGSKVKSNPQTKSFLRSSSPTVNITGNSFNVRQDSDIDSIIDGLVLRIRQELFNTP